jgi:hypothetical protein
VIWAKRRRRRRRWDENRTTDDVSGGGGNGDGDGVMSMHSPQFPLITLQRTLNKCETSIGFGNNGCVASANSSGELGMRCGGGGDGSGDGSGGWAGDGRGEASGLGLRNQQGRDCGKVTGL